MTPIFWYLISPEANLDRTYAHECARDAVQRLLHAGLRVYSPILHAAGVEPLADPDYEPWARSAFMSLAKGAVVLTLPGWKDDDLTTNEIKFFHEHKKPILEYATGDNHGPADQPPVPTMAARTVGLYASPDTQTIRIPDDGDPSDVWMRGGVGFTGASNGERLAAAAAGTMPPGPDQLSAPLPTPPKRRRVHSHN